MVLVLFTSSDNVILEQNFIKYIFFGFKIRGRTQFLKKKISLNEDTVTVLVLCSSLHIVCSMGSNLANYLT